MPLHHISPRLPYQGHRLKLVQQFCHVIDPKTNTVVAARHPVEPLSHSGFEYLHRPFDTAEVRPAALSSEPGVVSHQTRGGAGLTALCVFL